jgi:ABC-type uncharacterized transport system ATPase subunit
VDQKNVIEIRNLTKMYGNHVGVKDLSLTVDKGEIMGFLGPNGAGKTTTIRSCLALLTKTAGEITIFGLDSHRDAIAIRKKTGYLLRGLTRSCNRSSIGFYGKSRNMVKPSSWLPIIWQKWRRSVIG